MRFTVFLSLFFAASLGLALAARQADLTTIKLNGKDCGPEGDATSDDGKKLDRLKNRFSLPGEEDIDPEVSLAAMLAPGSDLSRFNPKKAATIQGFVVNVLVGGKETCNCHATTPDERDTHIELALSEEEALATQRVIVEVTPRLRMLRKMGGGDGSDWRTATLKNKIKGKWVEVTGWLLFDTMHINEAENTNPGNPGNWRATCWELHPITQIKLLPAAPAPLAAFQPKSFAALQQSHAAHVAMNPKGNGMIEKRNKEMLSKFDKEERKEAEEEAKERRPRDK